MHLGLPAVFEVARIISEAAFITVDRRVDVSGMRRDIATAAEAGIAAFKGRAGWLERGKWEEVLAVVLLRGCPRERARHTEEQRFETAPWAGTWGRRCLHLGCSMQSYTM